MKFELNYSDKKEDKLLIYDTNEHGFNMIPYNYATDLGLSLNYLDLMVLDKKVIQISGFCGLSASLEFNSNIPQFKEGSLSVIDDLEIGVGSYRITKEELPIYLHTETGWVCIGDPEKKGIAVEFINNCVAVIDDNKEFVSLWLKPQSLLNTLL